MQRVVYSPPVDGPEHRPDLALLQIAPLANPPVAALMSPDVEPHYDGTTTTERRAARNDLDVPTCGPDLCRNTRGRTVHR